MKQKNQKTNGLKKENNFSQSLTSPGTLSRRDVEGSLRLQQ